MPTKVQELAGQIREKSEKLAAFYAKKGPDGTLDVTAAERDEMKGLNDFLNAQVPVLTQLRQDEIDERRAADAIKSLSAPAVPPGFFGAAGTDGAGTDGRGEVKSLGAQFTESDGYKSFQHARRGGASPKFETVLDQADIKTLMTRSAGWAPFVSRQPGYVSSAQQMPKIADLMPSTTLSEMGVKWMLETTYTNAAAPTAEGGAYAESAFALTEQYSAAKKIAHFIPVTEEQLADAPAARDYLDQRMLLGLKQKLDQQLITGDGTGENLLGFNNLTGVQTQAQGADVLHDAVFKLITKIGYLGFANASALWFHPLDWQNARLFRTSQGLYLFGNPDQEGTPRMWGLPVATSTYITPTKAIAGDFQMYSQIYYRQGATVEATNSHADYFTSGKLAVRAQIRACAIYTRPAAFGIATLNANGNPTV